MEEEFKRLADDMIRTLRSQTGVELKYDAESVAWLDGFIERQRESFPGDEAEGLVIVIGSFLGECVIANFGGRWSDREDEGWCVVFDEGTAVFPFNKTRKQFANGREGGDSIESFYNVVPVVVRSMSDVV